MVENKSIMARNIRRLMEEKKVNATDVCEALNFKHNTFSDWVNGKSYPRIDKIELMANYFNVSKSDLVEEPIHFSIDDAMIEECTDKVLNKKALEFYFKYLAADKKTRTMIDMLLEEGE